MPEPVLTYVDKDIYRIETEGTLQQTVLNFTCSSGCMSAFFLFALIARFFVDFGKDPFAPHLLMLGVTLAYVTAGFFLVKSTKSCFIFDRGRRAILFQSRFFSSTREEKIPFEDLFAAGVDSFQPGRNAHTEWEYSLVLILKTGRVIPLTMPQRDRLNDFNHAASALSEHCGIRYIEGRAHESLKIHKGSVISDPEITYGTPLIKIRTGGFNILLTGCGTFVLVMFTYILLMHLFGIRV